MADYGTYRMLTGRIRMHVMDWPGADPPVLFLHGFTANGLAALPLGRLLCGQRRLIAPDLRGRGHTDMPGGEYGMTTHLADLEACINRLHLDSFVAAGHSFGATLSVFLAARFPERIRGLILFDGGAIPGPLAVQFLDYYYSTLQYRYANADDYVNRFKNAPLYQPWTDDLEQLVRSNLFRQPDGTYMRNVPRYVVEADKRVDNLETWQQLPELYPKISCPVLILRAEMGAMGREDQVLPDDVIETMRRGLPQAQVVTVEGAGHTSLLTIPAPARDAAILDFLKQIA